MFITKRPLDLGVEDLTFWMFFYLFQNVPAALYTDPNEIAQYLTLKLTDCEKLELPVRQPQTVNQDCPSIID